MPRKALPALRVLGQSQRTYIIAEGPDGVYLIDQHAAHERVLFERVKTESNSNSREVQGLIEPVKNSILPLCQTSNKVLTGVDAAVVATEQEYIPVET